MKTERSSTRTTSVTPRSLARKARLGGTASKLLLSMAMLLAVLGVMFAVPGQALADTVYKTYYDDGTTDNTNHAQNKNGLTVSGDNIQENVDYKMEAVTYRSGFSPKMIHVLSDKTLTFSGTTEVYGIHVPASNKNATIELNGVNITGSTLPVNVSSGAKLRLVVKDKPYTFVDDPNNPGKKKAQVTQVTNVLKPTWSTYTPGIRCPAGATLMLDDGTPNYEYYNGQIDYTRHIQNSAYNETTREGTNPFDYGRIPDGTTYLTQVRNLDNGSYDWTRYTANRDAEDKSQRYNRLSYLDSPKEIIGELDVHGGDYCAGIGGANSETAGTIIIDGGKITSKARDDSNNNAASGAGIGGGNGGSGGTLIFNGGYVSAYASYHGAGIGGGWNNGKTDNYVMDNAKYVTGTTNSGNIYINGGLIDSHGASHGNAFGQACGGNAAGCEIVITGGTLLPSSVSNRYDIGGENGSVYVLGGSVRVLNNKFQAKVNGSATNSTAYGSYHRNGGDIAVRMATIDYSNYDGSANGYTEVMDMTIAGTPVGYGLPHSTDEYKKLYLWLSSSASGEVSVDMSLLNQSEEPIPTSPFFITEISGAGDKQLKQYCDFMIPDQENNTVNKEVTISSGYDAKTTYTKGLSTFYPTRKHYDGLAYGYGKDLTGEIDGEDATENVKKAIASIPPLVAYPQTNNKPSPVNAEAKLTIESQETNRVGESYGSGTITGSPNQAGYNQLMVTSSQYTGGSDFGSFWGHRAYFNSIYISPGNTMTDISAVSLVTSASGDTTEQPIGVGENGDVNTIDGAHPIKFTISVRPWRTYADGTTEYSPTTQKALLTYNGETLTQSMVEAAEKEGKAYYQNKSTGVVELKIKTPRAPSGYTQVKKGSEALTVAAPTGTVMLYALPGNTATTGTPDYDSMVYLGKATLATQTQSGGNTASTDIDGYEFSTISYTLDLTDPETLVAFGGSVPTEFSVVARYVGFDDALRDVTKRINYNKSYAWFAASKPITLNPSINPVDSGLDLQVMRDGSVLSAPEYATSVGLSGNDNAQLTARLLKTSDNSVIPGGAYEFTLVDQNGTTLSESAADAASISVNENGVIIPKSQGDTYVKVTRKTDGVYQSISRVIKVRVMASKLIAHSQFASNETKAYTNSYVGFPLTDILKKASDNNGTSAANWAAELGANATTAAAQTTKETYRLLGWTLGTASGPNNTTSPELITSNNVLNGSYGSTVDEVHVWAVYGNQLISSEEGSGPWIRKDVSVKESDTVEVSVGSGTERLPIVTKPIHITLTANDILKTFKNDSVTTKTLNIAKVDSAGNPIYKTEATSTTPSDPDEMVGTMDGKKVMRWKKETLQTTTWYYEVEYELRAQLDNDQVKYTNITGNLKPADVPTVTTSNGLEVAKYKSVVSGTGAAATVSWQKARMATKNVAAYDEDLQEYVYSSTALEQAPSDPNATVKDYYDTDVPKYQTEELNVWYQVKEASAGIAQLDAQGKPVYNMEAPIYGDPEDLSTMVKRTADEEEPSVPKYRTRYRKAKFTTQVDTTVVPEVSKDVATYNNATQEFEYEEEYLADVPENPNALIYKSVTETTPDVPLYKQETYTKYYELTVEDVVTDQAAVYAEDDANGHKAGEPIYETMTKAPTDVPTVELKEASGVMVALYNSNVTIDSGTPAVTWQQADLVAKTGSFADVADNNVPWDTIQFKDKLPEGTALVDSTVKYRSTRIDARAATNSEYTYDTDSRLLTVNIAKSNLNLNNSVQTDDIYLEFDITTNETTLGKIVSNDAAVSLFNNNSQQAAGVTNRVDVGPIQDSGFFKLNKTATNKTAGTTRTRTHVGDVIHYEVIPVNSKVYDWKGVLIYDRVPSTLTVDPSSIKVMVNNVATPVAEGVFDEDTNSISVIVGDIKPGNSQGVKLVFDATVNYKATAASIANIAYAHGGGAGETGHAGDVGSKADLGAGGIGALQGRVESSVTVPFEKDQGTNGGEPAATGMLLVRERTGDQTVRRYYYADQHVIGKSIVSVLEEAASNASADTPAAIKSAQGWANTLTNNGGYRESGKELVGWTLNPATNVLLSATDVVTNETQSVYPVYAAKVIAGTPTEDETTTDPVIIKQVADVTGSRQLIFNNNKKYKVDDVSGTGAWMSAHIYDELLYSVTIKNIASIDGWNQIQFTDKLSPSLEFSGLNTVSVVSAGDKQAVSVKAKNYDETTGTISVVVDKTTESSGGITVMFKAKVKGDILTLSDDEQETQRCVVNDASIMLKKVPTANQENAENIAGGHSNKVVVHVSDEGEQSVTKSAQNPRATAAGRTEAYVGDSIQYTVTARNTKTYPWKGVILYDVPSPVLDVDPSSLKLVVDGVKYTTNTDTWYDATTRTIRVSAGDIKGTDDAGEEGGAAVLTYSATVNQLALSGTSPDSTNTAYAHGSIGTATHTASAGTKWTDGLTNNNFEATFTTYPGARNASVDFKVSAEQVAAPEDAYLMVMDPTDNEKKIALFYTNNNATSGHTPKLMSRSINELAGTGSTKPGVTAIAGTSTNIKVPYTWATTPKGSGGAYPGSGAFIGWTRTPKAKGGDDALIADFETVPQGITVIYPVYATERMNVTKTMTYDEANWGKTVDGTTYPLVGASLHCEITSSIESHNASNAIDTFEIVDTLPEHTQLVKVWVKNGSTEPVELTESEYTLDGRTFTYTAPITDSSAPLPTIIMDLSMNEEASAIEAVLGNLAVVSAKQSVEGGNDLVVATGQGSASVGPVQDPGTRTITKEAKNLSAAGRTYTQVGDRVKYTITLTNDFWFNKWNNAAVYDELPAALDIDTSSIVVRNAMGTTYRCPNAVSKDALSGKSTLAVFVGDVPGVGHKRTESGEHQATNTKNTATVEFVATVTNKTTTLPSGQTKFIMQNRAQVLDGVDKGLCAQGASTPGQPVRLPANKAIDDYEDENAYALDYLESEYVMPFEDSQQGQHQVQGNEALLLACWRGTEAVSGAGPDYPHLGYVMPNAVVGEQIVSRTAVMASVTGAGSLRAYYPEGANPDPSGPAEATESANEWAQKKQSNGGAMPNEGGWTWLGWTDDPKTSWNANGTDRILGVNDLVKPGINRIYPVYIKVPQNATEDQKPTVDPTTGEVTAPKAYQMEKGLVGKPVGAKPEDVKIYQELEYRIAAKNLMADNAWDSVTLMDKFPSYTKLVPGSVSLAYVDYSALTGEEQAAGKDGEIKASYPLEQSDSVTEGKYTLDEQKGLISFRATRSWLSNTNPPLDAGWSCELRFKVYVTREALQAIANANEPVSLDNDGAVAWYPPNDPDNTDSNPIPLWEGTETSPIGTPADSTGGHTVEVDVTNKTGKDGEVNIGDTVTTTIEVSNTEDYPWEDVRIKDTIPAGYDIDPTTIRIIDGDGNEHRVDPSAYNPNTRELIVAAGDIEPGESVKLIYDSVINNKAGDSGTNMENKVDVRGLDPYESDQNQTHPIGSAVPWPTNWPTTAGADTTYSYVAPYVINKQALDVTYTAHCQTHGWKAPSGKNGTVAGTTGQCKRLEAITAKVNDATIEYRSHIQGNGWESRWARDGAVSGTTGQSKRLEAIEMRLVGNAVNKGYHVWYRVHSQTYGWLGWAKDGEVAGTTGQSKRAEAYQVVVLADGEFPPGYDANRPACIQWLKINAHVRSNGWLGEKQAGIVGTTGQSKRLEALSIKLHNPPVSGGIRYSTHLRKNGWTGWSADGAVSGTTGQSRRAEAVKIELTGEMARQYSVWYRVHSQTYGWLGWAKDGEVAGTTGLSKRAEAVDVQILPKGAVPLGYNRAPASYVR